MTFFRLFEDYGLLLKVDKGQQIFHEGENSEELFFIQSGTVQLSKETENGKELTIRICGPKSIIGEYTLFDYALSHSTTAKALSQTELLMISKQSLELHLTEQPSLMIQYLKWVQQENLKNQSLIRDLVMNGKKGALYSTLIRLANTYGKRLDQKRIAICFTLTNTEMANICSTSREMVNRMLNDLKKNDIISIEHGQIIIHDLTYLKKECCCENCPTNICRID